jgi:hypothetical protein
VVEEVVMVEEGMEAVEMEEEVVEVYIQEAPNHKVAKVVLDMSHHLKDY